MQPDDNIPILIPESCVKSTSSLADVAWNFALFLLALEKRGAVWAKLPDAFRDVGALNTSCGGHRGNGSRTSLRNLVVLEGLEFTRAFLTAARNGTKRLGWNMRRCVFDAELAWLDEVGEDAPRLLGNYGLHIQALEDANEMFFEALKLDLVDRTAIRASLSDELQERFMRAERNEGSETDGHYSRIYAYVMGHPALSIVPMSDGSNSLAHWDSEVEKCTERIKLL